jgi:hypothetical protein
MKPCLSYHDYSPIADSRSSFDWMLRTSYAASGLLHG